MIPAPPQFLAASSRRPRNHTSGPVLRLPPCLVIPRLTTPTLSVFRRADGWS